MDPVCARPASGRSGRAGASERASGRASGESIAQMHLGQVTAIVIGQPRRWLARARPIDSSGRPAGKRPPSDRLAKCQLLLVIMEARLNPLCKFARTLSRARFGQRSSGAASSNGRSPAARAASAGARPPLSSLLDHSRSLPTTAAPLDCNQADDVTRFCASPMAGRLPLEPGNGKISLSFAAASWIKTQLRPME